MNHPTSHQSLVFSLLLAVAPFTVCAAGTSEHEIADAQVKKALASLKTDGKENHAVAEAVCIDVDLSKVNSSTEQPSLSFTAIESSIDRIEYELADLKVHLADMKESVALQARDEKNLRTRLKAELDRKTITVNTTLAKEDLLDEDESGDDTIDEDDDMDIDEEQDAVAIIAKEYEAA